MEMANLIRDSPYDLLDIIEDILDFSKIEAGKLEIERVPMSLTNVVEKSCGVIEQLAVRKNVELTLFTDPAIPSQVMGDALRLRQVLINIINNAIKFSSGQEKVGKVSLRTVLTESNADQIMISFQITDNGIGMDEATQQRLFTSFTQADTSTTRRFGGTGLGLAISLHLVELMDGKITVQSTPGKGSTFSILLPFESLVEHPTSEMKATDLTGLFCLVLGEHQGLSDDLVVYLESAGATIVQLTDGKTARPEIESLSHGLWVVILDAEHDTPPFETLRTSFSKRCASTSESCIAPRFVIIKRGRRRHVRTENEDIITLDGDIMYRESFINAVAIASGRIQVAKDKPATSRLDAAPVPPTREQALQRNQLILVAEDNDINQKVIRQQLALLGYAVDIANDGQEALKRWQTGDYALLLTDLHMPNLDGYQLTQAIRSAESEPTHLPIIALTANALKGEMENCRRIGMDDYLSKPVQLPDLQAMLEKYLLTSKPAAVSAVKSLTATPQSVAVDVHVLEELIGDDPETIKALLQDFQLSATKTAKDLQAAFDAGDFKTVGATAHKLKSSARSVGALALGELCFKMEQAGKENNGEQLKTLLPNFDEEMIKVMDYLRTFLE